MKSITIKGSKRESVGKAASKALRNAGKVPCVVYGGEAPIHFSADELAFNKLVYTPNIYTVDIKLDDGTEIESIMQDIQFHPVTDKILHIDFYVLRKGREITLDIPVRVQGDAIGVKNGGVFRFTLRKLSITSIPKNMPDFIMVVGMNNTAESSLAIVDKLRRRISADVLHRVTQKDHGPVGVILAAINCTRYVLSKRAELSFILFDRLLCSHSLGDIATD